jgi:hypothetical protein
MMKKRLKVRMMMMTMSARMMKQVREWIQS